MKRAVQVQSEVEQIEAVGELTSVFEGIASLRISQIKDRVLASTRYFNDLWFLYTQFRLNPEDRLQNMGKHGATRSALVVVTGAGGLTGDIDEQIVSRMLEDYDAESADIMVIGAHGSTLLKQRGIRIAAEFPLPEGDEKIDVTQLSDLIKPYKDVTVYYEQYQSLFSQSVERIELLAKVRQLGEDQAGQDRNVISSRDYVFEPSLKEVINYMEGTMFEIALSQVILESKLAQLASRFKAMHQASRKAVDMKKQIVNQYHRARRAESDERLKEVIGGLHR